VGSLPLTAGVVVHRGDDLGELRSVLRRADADRARHVVLVSTAMVYGAWADNPVPLPETAPLRPNPGFRPAVEKAEAERLVTEWGADHPDAKVAVLRPTVTVGADGSTVHPALAGTRSPRASHAGRPVQLVHADDVASAVTTVVERELGGAFNVAPDGWISDERARELAGGMARFSLPRRLAGTLVPPEVLPYAIHPWVVANDRLRAAGWSPTYTNEEALLLAAGPTTLQRLSPTRRQELALGGAAVALIGAATTAVILVRRRIRGRRPSAARPS
jgi:nucleoside-diphosphate-sugar epimerase